MEHLPHNMDVLPWMQDLEDEEESLVVGNERPFTGVAMSTKGLAYDAISTTGKVTVCLSGNHVEMLHEFLSGDGLSSWELKCTVSANANAESDYQLDAEATFQGTPPPQFSYGRLECNEVRPAVFPACSNSNCRRVQTGTTRSSTCQFCGYAMASSTPTTSSKSFPSGMDRLRLVEAFLIKKTASSVNLSIHLFHFKRELNNGNDEGVNRSLSCLLAGSLKSGHAADVVFVVGDQEVHAHSQVLAAASEVFSAMFFKHETEDKITRRVPLKDVKHSTFKEMMRCVYTDSPPVFTDDAVLLELVTLSDRYGLGLLLAQCQALFMDTMSVDNVSDRLRWVETVPCPALVAATLAYFMKRPAPESWTAAIRDDHPCLAVLLDRGSPRSRAPVDQPRVRSLLGDSKSSGSTA